MSDWTGGLAADKDLMLAERPADPEMRESASIWLFDDDGAFALPRVGIEAEAKSWDLRGLQANIALPGGRTFDGANRGAAHPPLGDDGRPSVLGAGPLRFECLEPFRRWRVTFDGDATEVALADRIAGTVDYARRSPVRFDVALTMATPAWVQDNSPERVATMPPADAAEAAYMGIGHRIEHLFRAEGSFEIDGATRRFTGTGSRIHRHSVRPLMGFKGHCWQSALFLDGRGFGYIAYPERDGGGEPYNEGYLYVDGRMIPARARRAPWLRRVVDEGDDVTLELESALGVTRIEGISGLSTYRLGNVEMGGLHLHQGGARYTWDGQTAWGMIERSSHESLVALG